MKKTLASAATLALALASFVATATPAFSWLGANRSCEKCTAPGGEYALTEYQKVFYDSATSWYTTADQAVSLLGSACSFSASLTGYTTQWKTYATAPKQYSDESPKNATEVIADGPTVDLTAVVGTKTLLAQLPVGPSGRALLYAFFTPIAYNLTYDLDGGSWPSKATYPATATYDVDFTVTNPSKTGHAFSGWDVDGQSYPARSGSSMTFRNLSETNGATVAFTAQWTPESYPLQLVVGEGVGEILYCVEETDDAWTDWQSVTVSQSVGVPYGCRYRCYAVAAHGYKGSGTGWSADSPVEGTMSVAGAKFKPVAEKVPFVVNVNAEPAAGGFVSGGGTFEYRTVTRLQATPVSGYGFAGWSDGATENPHEITVLSATNVTARFEPSTYSLKLSITSPGIARIWYRVGATADYTNVTSTTKVPVPYGTAYAAYADTVAGYELAGAGSSATNPFEGTMGATDVTFEPTPTKATYEVIALTDPADAGTTSVQPAGKLALGETATVSVTPKQGYRFIQWDEMRSGAKRVSPNPTMTFTVTNSASLVAVLAKESYTVTFVYTLADGTEYGDKQTVAYGESAVEPPAEKRNNWPGHTFAKWDDSAWQTVTRDMTVYAIYSDNEYAVRFNANGGTGTMSDQTFVCGQEKALAANAFSRTGYTFEGWSADPAATARQYRDQQTVRDLTASGSITLYAVWTPIYYTVRYEPGNADGEAYEEYHAYDERLTLPTKAFSATTAQTGWLDRKANRLYAAGETVTRLSSTAGEAGKVTLVAQWGEDSQIRFHANHPEADPNRQYAYQVFSNDVENALTANAFVRRGYTFAGWATEADAGVRYGDQALLENPAQPGETLDLYAVWQPNTYQVIFDGNGNVPTTKGVREQWVSQPSIIGTNGINIVVQKEKELIYDQHNFIGWGTNKTDVCFKADATTGNATINFTDRPPNDHIRLYAIWDPPTAQTTQSAAPIRASLNASKALASNSEAELSWKNDGWTVCGDGVYSNGCTNATLSTTITTSGKLTFEWMPSAVGDFQAGEPLDPEGCTTITNVARLSGAGVKVMVNDTLLQSYTGKTARSWSSVTVAVENVSSETALKFTSDARHWVGETDYSGVYPVMLRKIEWIPQGADPSVTNTVTFICSNVTWADDGEATNRVVQVPFGTSVLLPDVTPKDGFAFDGWYDASNARVAGAGESVAVYSSQSFTAVATNIAAGGSGRWTTRTVTFRVNSKDAAKGCRIAGGKFDDTVAIVTNSTGEIWLPGQALEPTVVGTNGWDFAEWYDENGRTNVAANRVAFVPIGSDAAFTACFTPHNYGIVYANVRSHNNPNPAVFTAPGGTNLQTNGAEWAGAYLPLTKIDGGASTNTWAPATLSPGVYGFTDETSGLFRYTNAVTQAQWADMAVTTDAEYSVTFRWRAWNGSPAGGGSVCTTAQTYTVRRGRNAVCTNDVNLAGYVFQGWDRSIDNVTADFATEAVYDPIRYPLTYENLKGAAHDNPEYCTIGDAFALRSPKNANANLQWLGWTTNGVPAGGVTAGTTNAIAFTGNWAYRVTYRYVSGGHIRSVAGETSGQQKAEAYVEEGCGTNAVPGVTCEAGYSFAGWQVTEPADAAARRALTDDDGYLLDALGDRAREGSVLTNVTQAMTLTAVATANVYRIEYANLEGATNNAANPLTYTVEDAVTFLPPEPAEVPDGEQPWLSHRFAGWSPAGIAKGTIQEVFVTTATWSVVTGRCAIVIGGVPRAVAYGETVSESVAASVTNGTTNVVCTGWVGTGSVPESGTGNAVSFVVTGPGTLDWQYQTNYWVSAEAAVDAIVPIASSDGGTVALTDASGTLASTEGWYAAGTNLTAVATPAEGWLFARWEGDESDSPTRSFAVRAPVSLTAVFTQKVVRTVFDVTVAVAAGCERMGSASGARANVRPGTKVTVKATAKSGYVFAGWYPVDADVSSASDAIETIASTPVSQSASYSFAMPADDVDLEAKFLAKGDDWATVSVGEVESEYAKGVAIDPIAVTAAGGSQPTVKVTGLPTGLKFANGAICGTPTRSGVYSATATATTVGKATASTNLALVVRAAGEQVVSTTVALVDADVSSASGAIETIASTAIPGKTTGQGVYAAGKKVTLKATANKGYVFSGWFVDADVSSASPVSRLASLALVVPENDVAYTAAFVETATDAAGISAGVNGLTLVSGGVAGTVETNVSAGVYLEWPVVADALSSATVAVSGLPSGLKFTAKPITAKVTSYDDAGRRVTTVVTNVPAMTIYGTPTAASKTDRWGETVRSQVKVTVTTAGRNKATGVIALAVDPIRSELVGTYSGGSTNEPVGSATVTLAKTGKVSGKWISEGLTWTLAATGLDFVDADVSSASDAIETIASTRYVATNVTAKSGKLAETVTLVFSVNDLGYGTVDAIAPIASDADETAASALFSATYVPWTTDATLKDLAKRLKGRTFVLDLDDGTRLEGKVGANGTVSVKGTFPADETRAKAYAATVSSVLVPVDADLSEFETFLYYKPVKNRFDGCAIRLPLTLP